jgi:hypothetical protein
MTTSYVHSIRRSHKGIALGIISVSFVLLLSPITIMASSTSVSTLPLSQAKIEKDIEKLNKVIVQWEEQEEKVELEDLTEFTNFRDSILAAKNAGEDLSDTFKTFKKLDKKYTDNNAYLYIISQVLWVFKASYLPEEISIKEQKSLLALLSELPKNHGNIGRLQKVRLVSSFLDYDQNLDLAFLDLLDVEELLIFKSGQGRGFNIGKFPSEETFENVGGESLVYIFDDLSLSRTDRIDLLLAKNKNEGRFARAERIAEISRYLYFRNIKPSRGTIHKAQAAIHKEQNAWKDQPLINDTVLYAATAGERFMDPRELSKISNLTKYLEVFSTDEGRTTAEARDEFLRAIVETEGPITAIINMHGNSDVVVFQDESEEQETGAELWSDELSYAFSERYVKWPKIKGTDVLILESCSSGSYAHAVLLDLLYQDSRIPIIAASGEAGQTTYTREEGGSEFGERYLFMGTQKVGDLYENYNWDEMGSNPLIFVPQSTKQRLPVQVS